MFELDQFLVAALALVAFSLFASGYFIGSAERKSRTIFVEVPPARENVETRSRRAF